MAPRDDVQTPTAFAGSGERAAMAAAILAFASAAVTLFWLLGGTLGLRTVGGQVEELARERSAIALGVGTAALVAKLVAGGLAAHLIRSRTVPRKPYVAMSLLGGAILTLYGGVLVLAGGLALAGAIDPSGPRDEYALRWQRLLLGPLVPAVGPGNGARRAARQTHSHLTFDPLASHGRPRPAKESEMPHVTPGGDRDVVFDDVLWHCEPEARDGTRSPAA